MELSETGQEVREEILEVFWTAQEKGGGQCLTAAALAGELGAAFSTSSLDQLAEAGLLSRGGEAGFCLTEAGYLEARRTIRRHRLSERLFLDVLDIGREEFESAACRFEHVLIKPGLEERICSLLGHPKTCPHGRSIPAGECCQRAEELADREVGSLDRLREGETGAVAFVQSGDPGRFRKIMAMGVLPGVEVTVVRRSPSFVFRLGYSQFAVDEGMAEAIFVRRRPLAP
jgi:DtxR family Mn-dependent transcriptional regulator